MPKTNTARKTKAPKTVNLKLASKMPTINPDVERLVQNSIVLDLVIHSPSFRRKIDSDDIIDDGTDTQMVHVSKDLIDKEAMKELRRAKGGLVRWLRFQEVPLPNSLLRGGMYLIPIDLTEKVDTEVMSFIGRTAELVDELIEKYDGLVKDAKGRLKEHFNSADYPEPDKLREAFSVDANWRPSLNIPAALEKTNREIFDRQKTKIEKEWSDAADEVPNMLKTLYLKLLEHSIERLGAKDDGKPQVFRDSMVQKINEFLSTFEARNLTNVEELNRLARRMRNVMAGVNAEGLRADGGTRQFVLTEFEKIKTQLDKAVVTKRRRFNLQEAK